MQVLCHSHDGMGGVGSALCQHLQDEYHNKSILTFPITPPTVATLSTATRTPLLVNTLMVRKPYGLKHSHDYIMSRPLLTGESGRKENFIIGATFLKFAIRRDNAI